MKSQSWRQNTKRPTFWLVVFCLTLFSLGLRMPIMPVFQSDASTPSPTLEPTVTPTPSETQPTSTNNTEEITSPTVISIPLITDTVAPISSPTSSSTDVPSPPILSGEYSPDEVLIRYKRTATDGGIQQCLSSASAIVLSSIEELGVLVVQVPFGKVAESISVISICPEVRYVEPNYMAFIADTIPSDPDWNLQDGLVDIRAPQGWDYSTGSAAVIIAIIDSGVDLSHADLAGKIVPGYDFVNNDTTAQDDNGHGTHVAGIAAAIGNNGIGIAGVS